MTEEQRKAASERMKKARENKKGIKKIMNDTKRALLGDQEIAKQLTDAANFREQIENEVLNRNTSAPILSAEEMEKLEGMHEDNVCS